MAPNLSVSLSAMRLHLVIVLTFSLGCGASSAQAGPVSPPATPDTDLPALRLLPSANPTMAVSPHRISAGSPQSRQKIHDRDVADCLQMWDSGTHMTKPEWANTCKRVQTRLDNLNVDVTMPKTKVR
jgi:hypothetical protein